MAEPPSPIEPERLVRTENHSLENSMGKQAKEIIVEESREFDVTPQPTPPLEHYVKEPTDQAS